MKLSLINRAVLFILSISFSVFIGTTAVQATSPHPFYWEKIDVDLKLIESGDLLVTETQKYVFTAPYTNQRTRYIQLDRIDEIRDITVTENNLSVANLRTSKADGKQYISWEHPSIATFPESHTFVIKYRVVGGLEVGNDRTQLKWMAIFPDRKAVVNSARIRLQMPVKLSRLTKNFTTDGVNATINYVSSTTIDFVSKGSIEPQAKLQILGEFPNTALDLKQSQWQSSSGNTWWTWLWIPFVWIISLFSSGASSSSGGGGDGGCGGCGGCGGGD
jgi:Predicted membrane protein (DUF2207)